MDNKKKILLIDNDAEVVAIVTSILKDISTIEVVHNVSDIERARYMLKNDEYCAILGNANLSSSAGVSCTDLIREAISDYGDRYYNKIIVMSTEIDKIVEALRNGAYMSIIKPIERTELRHKLSIIIDAHLKSVPPPKRITERPQ